MSCGRRDWVRPTAAIAGFRARPDRDLAQL